VANKYHRGRTSECDIVAASLANMGTPTKRRKLNDSSKGSPAKNLDFFFGKQQQQPPPQTSGGELKCDDAQDDSTLTDEQLARKLQAQWNNEVQERPENGLSSIELPNGPGEEKPSIEEHKKHTEDGTEYTPVLVEKHGSTVVAMTAEVQPAASTSSSNSKGKSTLSLQSMGSAEDIVTSNIPFDESPLTFEPAKYVADLQKHWAVDGGNASYALLTRCFVLVNSTQSRIKIVDTLVNLLRVLIEGDPSSLLPTVCTNIQFLQSYSFALQLCLDYSLSLY
jgi:DNA ligase-1